VHTPKLGLGYVPIYLWLKDIVKQSYRSELTKKTTLPYLQAPQSITTAGWSRERHAEQGTASPQRSLGARITTSSFWASEPQPALCPARPRVEWSWGLNRRSPTDCTG